MSVSNSTDIAQSILAAGFPSVKDYSKNSLFNFVEKVQDDKNVRFFGSEALSLAYLTSGLVDAYAEGDIMLWDVDAVIALLGYSLGEYSFQINLDKEWVCSVQCVCSTDILKQLKKY